MTPGAPIPGVGVAVVRHGELLLVKRGRGSLAGRWAVPGGKVDLGESLIAAAAREVREETGVEVEIGDVLWVGETIGPGDPPEWHFVLIDFLGVWKEGEPEPGDDAAEARWVPLDQARGYDLTPTMYPLLETLQERMP